jgi:2-polyprenyl-3-methyl-5-hydroxy-6-metoxy-1,4-benzoquinol methylase
MNFIDKIQNKIYKTLKFYRLKQITKILDKNSKTILDIGCQDLIFYNKIKENYSITLADYSPTNSLIKKEDVQNLSFEDKSYDIVLCQEVLEHVSNPIAAIKELKRVAKKQLIISIPYEPFFTLTRLLFWEKEHLWAIRPKIFYHYLGKPTTERKIFFKRYYLATWNFK